MAVSKRLRFEILRRDNYTCRYCGANPEDRELRVDHVVPVALGGKDEPTNLVTACDPCNTGKSSIAPDSELVADVEEKALLWGRAYALAIERRALVREAEREVVAAFETEWMHRYTVALPLGNDWEQTVIRFVQRGLSMDELEDAIDIAYTAPIRADSVWKYFCGVCWRKLEDLERHARHLIDEGEVN